ncbi:hypothetical protein [Nocardia arizonensis]|uniref:hypothetical protein n=1 Tax=Nocardia arizonensis TaxID=1141647 RepID=UPI000AF2746D|nr:hypothetical protein [Nocardia arizonensis]
MQVDPGQLRALAEAMSGIGAEIDTIRTQVDTSALTAALPGSVLARACCDAGSVAGDALSRMAAGCAAVAALVEASASTTQAADNSFADRIATAAGGLL